MPHLDQDEFFNGRLGKPMPETWSPVAQRYVTLYDTESAVDWSAFTDAIKSYSARKIIAITGISGSGKSTVAKALMESGMVPNDILILTGFYLPPCVLERYDVIVHSHIILAGINVELCAERRRVSKAALSAKFNAANDEWMVRNHVVPFFINGITAIRNVENYLEVNASQPLNEVIDNVKKIFHLVTV